MSVWALLSRAATAVAGFPARVAQPVLPRSQARRRYTQPGRVHIAVRGLHRAESGQLDLLRERLRAMPGVTGTEVNGPLGRVVVRHVEQQVDLDAVIEEISAFERDTGLDTEAFCPLPYPGDWEPLAQHAMLVGAGVVGAAAAVVGRAARLPSLAQLVPTVIMLTDSTPHLRRWVDRGIGSDATGLVVGYGSTVTQALAQRPLGLLVDVVHRANLLSETMSYRRAWQRREAVIATDETAFEAPPIAALGRPVPLADGPVGRAAGRTATAAAVAAAATLITTRRADRAATVLSAGVLRPAVLGGEAFCAQLGRSCAARDIVVFDAGALRRMDRVDVLVFDASALLTGDSLIEDIIPVAEGLRFEELYLHAHALVDLHDVTARRDADGWTVHPLTRRTADLPAAARAAIRDWTHRGATVLRIDRDGRPAGLIAVMREIDPFAESLVTRAKAAGTVLIAGGRSALSHRLDVDGTVAGGSRLAASVRDLQRSGRCVALVSGRQAAALAAADIGIAVAPPGSRVPWGAHILCTRGLGDAHLLIDALPVARRVAGQALRLSVVASTAVVLFAALSRAPSAGRGAQLPPAVAAGISLMGGTWYALSVAARPPPVSADRTAWHAMPVETVMRLLSSSPAGLAEREAARRHLNSDGSVPTGGAGVVQTSVEELANPISAALAISAAMSAVTGSALDAVLIGAVLLFNALIGALQRLAANRALRRLTHASSARVRLHRDGAERSVTPGDLVAGDVIELRAGDAVPADCRVLHAASLEVDESGLTGESQPVLKTPAPSPAPALADRHSMLYEGTAIAVGSGRAVVTATGDATELGRTMRAADHARRPDGVQARLRLLMRLSVPISLGAGVALLASTVLRGGSFAQAVGPATNLAVAAVPEGLPFVATVAELAAARRLSARGALVRQPATLEALGRVDVLCFDKTGTLTQGRITLRRVSDGRRNALADELPIELRAVVAAALRATPEPDRQHQLPHATDRAVVDGARRSGVDATDGLGTWRRIDDMPFEPRRGFHAVLGEHDGGPIVAVKGAPEIVLDRCTTWQRGGVELPLTDSGRRELDAEVERLARRGYRVLAVAQRAASGRQDLTDSRINNLRLLGLLGLADAVRPTAKAAVANLRQAGVRVVMVTGDHPGTATAIADELDVLNGEGVMTGPDLDRLDDAELARQLPHVVVFARVTPGQKSRIVEGLRAAGCTVAVTGDGANDAPAIRLAHIGMALGAGATAAAREAADIVITDDRLETIVDALLEGRAMWASVRDALTILLGGNLGEVLFTVGAGVASGRNVLNTRQLMLVNLLTDVLPAMAVAVRPPPHLTREVLVAEGPESSLGAALTEGIVIRAAATSLAAFAAWILARLSGTAAHAATVGLVALVSAQLGQTAAAGMRSPLVLAAASVSLAGLVGVVQTPGVSHFFGCRPLGPVGWGIALAAAAAATILAVILPTVLRRAQASGHTTTPDDTPSRHTHDRAGTSPVPA